MMMQQEESTDDEVEMEEVELEFEKQWHKMSYDE